MAIVYILYSEKLDRYYIGSCLDINQRLIDHKNKKFANSYTCKADDWVLFYVIEDLKYKQARLIEKHVKNMKSRKYLENLKLYKEISENLRNQYKRNK